LAVLIKNRTALIKKQQPNHFHGKRTEWHPGGLHLFQAASPSVFLLAPDSDVDDAIHPVHIAIAKVTPADFSDDALVIDSKNNGVMNANRSAFKSSLSQDGHGQVSVEGDRGSLVHPIYVNHRLRCSRSGKCFYGWPF
jgi:hypothetical protein